MSYDIKLRGRAIEYWDDGHSKKETAAVFKVGTTTLQTWKFQLKESGTLASKKRKETWRKVDPKKLCAYLEQYPDAYLREIAEEFSCSENSIFKALKRLKISRKKTTLYKEINESFRQVFVEMVKTIPPESIVYVDECGIDQCLYREYARALRGEKIIAKVSGKKFKRTNILSGICEGNWVAPLQYDWNTDSALVELWFEQCLLKEVKKGTFIVLDNAAFHRKTALKEITERHGCYVLFLPPYSPDLNPIEKKWAWLKKKLRKILQNYDSVDLALQNCFQAN